MECSGLVLSCDKQKSVSLQISQAKTADTNKQVFDIGLHHSRACIFWMTPHLVIEKKKKLRDLHTDQPDITEFSEMNMDP